MKSRCEYWTVGRRGNVKPAAVVAVGAWYFLSDSPGPLGNNVEVTIDGKKVDPKTVMKGSTMQLPGGGSFTLAGGTFNPSTMLGDVFKDYFALPEGPARTKFIDDHIDQQEAVRKQIKLDEGGSTPQVRVGSDAAGTAASGPPRKIQIRAGSGADDSLSPELRAQIAEFGAAVAKRRAERGLPPQQGMMLMRTKKAE